MTSYLNYTSRVVRYKLVQSISELVYSYKFQIFFFRSNLSNNNRLVNGLVYYGVTLASKNLSDNFHRNFILSSLVEFPAAVVAVLASMR